MQKITLFDESLHAVEYDKHAETKKKFIQIIEDIKATSMNTNDFNHMLVYKSPPGLQMNNAFHDLITCKGLQDFSMQKIHDVILPKDKKFAITSMWATIIPKYALLVPKEHEGVYYGTYFLHSPTESGMILFHNNIDDSWYSKFGNTINNEHNHNVRSLNMPEGGIYLIPSYTKVGTSTNMYDDPNVQINFVIDIVDN